MSGQRVFLELAKSETWVPEPRLTDQRFHRPLPPAGPLDR